MAGRLAQQISGIGAISCVGIGADSLWERTLAERSGIADGLGLVSDSVIAELRDAFPRAAGSSKSVLFALAAITEAMRQAGWHRLNDDDGLILATTTGQIPVWEREVMEHLRGAGSQSALLSSLKSQSLGSLTMVLAELLGFRGRTMLVSSACSASTQAIGLASLWLAQGKVKRCLVGGVEVLCNITLEGFRCMQLLTTAHSTPFDANRKGINLSEAAAFLCLEPETGTHPLALLSGHGISTDGYHMTAPHPEGAGSFAAMRAALDTAAISPSDVSWVHAHGTGSRHNDQSEGNAIARLFGSEAPPASSTKWVHGHALGASGALETALCVQALRKQTLVRTVGLEEPDPAIPLRHATTSAPTRLRHILKNTLGFGGTNAALVLSDVESGRA